MPAGKVLGTQRLNIYNTYHTKNLFYAAGMVPGTQRRNIYDTYHMYGAATNKPSRPPLMQSLALVHFPNRPPSHQSPTFVDRLPSIPQSSVHHVLYHHPSCHRHVLFVVIHHVITSSLFSSISQLSNT